MAYLISNANIIMIPMANKGSAISLFPKFEGPYGMVLPPVLSLSGIMLLGTIPEDGAGVMFEASELAFDVVEFISG